MDLDHLFLPGELSVDILTSLEWHTCLAHNYFETFTLHCINQAGLASRMNHIWAMHNRREIFVWPVYQQIIACVHGRISSIDIRGIMEILAVPMNWYLFMQKLTWFSSEAFSTMHIVILQEFCESNSSSGDTCRNSPGVSIPHNYHYANYVAKRTGLLGTHSCQYPFPKPIPRCWTVRFLWFVPYTTYFSHTFTFLQYGICYTVDLPSASNTSVCNVSAHL
jgi:hypothetical protein